MNLVHKGRVAKKYSVCKSTLSMRIFLQVSSMKNFIDNFFLVLIFISLSCCYSGKIYSFTPQEIQNYIQLMLTIDKALEQDEADSRLIAVEKDYNEPYNSDQ